MPALCIDDEDDEEARFQADLARAIATSKANASPATSIASLSSDQSQTADVGTAPTSASAVATTHTGSSFLAERAQLEQQRLARLKRLRGSTDSHITGPPSKRRASSRETNGTAGPSRRENETVGQEAEVFWDGQLRQTANMHVEPGHNGTNGKPVFRLSQIIGDVRLFLYPLVLVPFADGNGPRIRR
jgi:tyrosyl-DNA phosphodiesterase-1